MASPADYGLDAAPALPPLPTPTIASPPSVREDMVANAVSFLAHPSVAPSAEPGKREFLVGKGLTPAEIEEAFRRAPAAGAVAPVAAPVAAPPQQALALALPPSPYRWTQVALGVAAAGAATAALARAARPRLEAWRAARAEAAAAAAARDRADAARATAAAVADAVGAALGAQAGELRAAVAAVGAAAVRLDRGKGPAVAASPGAGGGLTRADLQAELAALGELLTAAAPPPPPPPPSISHEAARQIATLREELAALRVAREAEPMGRWSVDGHGGRVAADAVAPAPAPPLPALPPPPHPASYTEVLAMLERGETPPGVRTDIVDEPAGGARAPPPPTRAPPPKPWRAGGGGGHGAAAADSSGDLASHPLRASAFGGAGSLAPTDDGGAPASLAASPARIEGGEDDMPAYAGVFGGDGGGWQPPAPPPRSLPAAGGE